MTTMQEDTTLTGHCYCGAVSSKVAGQPVKIGNCHCESCRRATGSAMASSAGYKVGQVSFTGSSPGKIESDLAERCFCTRCGSPVSYRRKGSDYLFVYLGLFDEPNKLVPQVHMMYSGKVDWLILGDGLPKSDDFA